MNNILDKIKANKVNYDQVLSNCIIDNIGVINERFRFAVIVPVRGREHFLPVLLRSFEDTGRMDFFFLVVEHSDYPQYRYACSVRGLGYVYIPSNGSPFNKCLCHNIGAFLAPMATYLIFHDLDCLVQRSFFDNIDACIDINIARALQTFNGRRVLYCSENLSAQLLGGAVDVNDLYADSESVTAGDSGAPGGSILISYDLFFLVGGYDPELFHSYSPEDAFFWAKIEIYSTVYSCDTNEVFHLYHPPLVKASTELPNFIRLMKEFSAMSRQEKIEITEYKQSLIKQYE